jgi:1-acyl-sn-glycerol-3-phosphate acyltransferase
VAFEKTDTKSMFKHTLLVIYAHAFYNNILGVKVVVKGIENLPKNNNFVVFSNHIEASDPMYIKQIYRKFPLSFVSKEVLFKKFPIKNVLRGMGSIPISPRADKSAMNSILESIKLVESGQPMGIFPEGRRTYSNDIIDFKPGAFKLPLKAKADIAPIAVYGMHDIYKKGRIFPIKVYITLLPMIPYEEYKDMDTLEIAKKVQNMVKSQMDLFSASLTPKANQNR